MEGLHGVGCAVGGNVAVRGGFRGGCGIFGVGTPPGGLTARPTPREALAGASATFPWTLGIADGSGAYIGQRLAKGTKLTGSRIQRRLRDLGNQLLLLR